MANNADIGSLSFAYLLELDIAEVHAGSYLALHIGYYMRSGIFWYVQQQLVLNFLHYVTSVLSKIFFIESQGFKYLGCLIVVILTLPP